MQENKENKENTKVYETQLISYIPRKVKSLGMARNGFPLIDGKPQDMEENTIVDLDGVLYLYAGEDEWSLAIDGVHYSGTKRIINFLNEPIWMDPAKALEKTRIA